MYYYINMAVQFYDEWYKNLINHSNEKFLLVEKISDLLQGKAHESCLEIGLGTSAFFAENLSENFSSYTIIEKESFSGDLPVSVKYIKADFVVCDFNEKYDVIIASHVVYYFDNLEKTVDKMLSILKEGGRIYFVVNGPDSDYGPLKNAFASMINKPYTFTYNILKNSLQTYKTREYTTQASLHFSDHGDLYNALRLSFDLFPVEYTAQKEKVIEWLKLNIQGEKFFIDQKIFEVTK